MPKKHNCIAVLFRSWFYMALNIWYFLFSKKWVDDKIKEYMSRKYSKDDVIVVALHGIFEYYWQSLTRYMKYFDKRGKVLIPLSYNYMHHHDEAIEKITKEIKDIHDKTGAKIVLLGNSSGSFVFAKYLYKTKGTLIEEFVSLAIGYKWTYKSVAFWWRWLDPMSEKEMLACTNQLSKDKIPKLNIAIYAKHDAFIPLEHRELPFVKNIGFDTGHFGALYDLDVIEYVYDYIFNRKH